MTPEQHEHLRLLKAHLKSLIEGASKRTAGEWIARSFNGIHISADKGHICQVWGCANDDNETFIASCAGNAEAGWKSTLAAIDYYQEHVIKWGEMRLEKQLLESILAAWPIETLKP